MNFVLLVCRIVYLHVFLRGKLMFDRSMPFLITLQRFWTGSGIGTNKDMVEKLQTYGVVRSKKVSEVMENIDRAFFVPDDVPPYVDTPVPIGYNATISAPHMHATCLQLLEKHLQPGMRALDVGSGSSSNQNLLRTEIEFLRRPNYVRVLSNLGCFGFDVFPIFSKYFLVNSYWACLEVILK